MSETVTRAGYLRHMKWGRENILSFMAAKLELNKHNLNDVDNEELIELFSERYYEKFYYSKDDEGENDALYRIELIVDNDYSYLFFSGNTDNLSDMYDIFFAVSYHNGGCSFSEALDEALK